jgi:hypothetical protein
MRRALDGNVRIRSDDYHLITTRAVPQGEPLQLRDQDDDDALTDIDEPVATVDDPDIDAAIVTGLSLNDDDELDGLDAIPDTAHHPTHLASAIHQLLIHANKPDEWAWTMPLQTPDMALPLFAMPFTATSPPPSPSLTPVESAIITLARWWAALRSVRLGAPKYLPSPSIPIAVHWNGHALIVPSSRIGFDLADARFDMDAIAALGGDDARNHAIATAIRRFRPMRGVPSSSPSSSPSPFAFVMEPPFPYPPCLRIEDRRIWVDDTTLIADNTTVYFPSLQPIVSRLLLQTQP